MNVTKRVLARIYATPRIAYDNVRLFVLDNPEDQNSTTSWQLVDEEFTFNATQLDTGITLDIDGLSLVTHPSTWDGSVSVRFEVTNRSNVAYDVVALKMAPVLTYHHL
jgi:protein-arginine deiminase